MTKGHNCYEVAEILGHSPTTMENWVYACNTQGIEGLHDESLPRRASRIPDTMMEQISWDLRMNSRDLGYAQNLWEGKLLSHHLEER